MLLNQTIEKLRVQKAEFTATEICQQPHTWNKTVELIKEMKVELETFINQVIKQPDYDVILTGAGTSEFVGNSIFPFLNSILDYKVKSYGTTDIVATPENYLSKTKPTLLVSYGRSGNSPESLATVEIADAVCENIYHLFITCNSEGALAKATKTRTNCLAINITPETHDKGFAMTSSFTNMYLATLLCFKLDELDEVATIISDVITKTTNFIVNDFEVVKKLIDDYDFNRIVYLGSNCLKGIAQESSLKLLELTAGKVTTMYDSPLGFRHGPKSVINEQTLTVLYLSDNVYTRQYEIDLLVEMSKERDGNRIMIIGNHIGEEASLADASYSFTSDTKLDNVYLGLQYIVVAQTIALFTSLSMNITPDDPCPSGEVNRVVKGVIIHNYEG